MTVTIVILLEKQVTLKSESRVLCDDKLAALMPHSVFTKNQIFDKMFRTLFYFEISGL